ncbi:hypothetical protein GCM10025331_50900 [Actinoplanes utahensis]|nr:hypothetical protein Aut01nite_65180 [Actinoplanes utahensis]
MTVVLGVAVHRWVVRRTERREPTELLGGIRTVATGAALLAPEVTRQLVGRYAARIRPARGAPDGGALTPRECSGSSRRACATARSPWRW